MTGSKKNLWILDLKQAKHESALETKHSPERLEQVFISEPFVNGLLQDLLF